MSELTLNNTLVQRLLRRMRKPWARRRAQQELQQQTLLAQRLIAQLTREGQAGLAGAELRIASSLRTRSDVVVALLADPGASAGRLALKLPLTPDAEQSLSSHRQVLLQLRRLPALEAFSALLPQPIAWGDYEGQPYYIETALPGAAAADLVRQHAEPAWMKQDAVWLIRQLHLGTLRRCRIDEPAFERLAGADLALLRQLAARWPEPAVLARKLDQVEALLRDEFAGAELPLSWTHGDYWPGNVLLQPGGGAISGIIDWDRAAADQMPLHDILHLLAYTRKIQRRSELGAEIVAYLLPAAFDPYERTLIKESLEQLDLPKSPTFFRAVTLLYWLRFAATNLSRYPAFQRDAGWLQQNVFLVLKRGLS